MRAVQRDRTAQRRCPAGRSAGTTDTAGPAVKTGPGLGGRMDATRRTAMAAEVASPDARRTTPTTGRLPTKDRRASYHCPS